MSFPSRCLPALALLLAVMLSGTICPTAGVAGQGKERTLVLKNDFNPPTKIKAVKAKGKEVKTGQKFLAGDDWFEGLTASIVNDTGKAVLSIQIDVWFVRPEDQARVPPYVYQLAYGADPFWFKPSEQYRTNKPPIPPGGAVDIALSPEDYKHIQSTLEELAYPAGQKKIEMRIGTIGFTDGTVWDDGRYLRRDPTAPDGWTAAANCSATSPRSRRRKSRTASSPSPSSTRRRGAATATASLTAATSSTSTSDCGATPTTTGRPSRESCTPSTNSASRHCT